VSRDLKQFENLRGGEIGNRQRTSTTAPLFEIKVSRREVMKKYTMAVIIALALVLQMGQYAAAQVSKEELKSISTPDKVNTSIGELKFFDGVPTDDTVKTLYDNLDRMMLDNNTPGLRRINEKALEGIGIKEPAIQRFLSNRKLTPRHQTAITLSLVSLKKVKNRETLLNHFSLRTRSYDDANVNQVVAAMIAGYNQKKSPITEVRTFENVVMFRNEKGAYVVAYPVDNFPWTEQTAAKTKKVSAALPSGAKKELWISGGFSEVASHNLKRLGWEVHGHSFERLDVGNPY